MDDIERERSRDEILLATLPHVSFDGWTMQALFAGAAAAGYGRIAALTAYPRDVRDLVEHFGIWADRQMEAAVESADLASMRVRDRVAFAVRARLAALVPHEEAERRKVSYLALPPHLGLGARMLYRTVDATWHAVGDTATDFSFYTKRALLAAVVAATTLYWLDDTSAGKEDTSLFLDRRIDDVMELGRFAGRLRQAGGLLDRLPSPIRFIRLARERLHEL
jgi:ubiquinone biosynthesis protein COQ9